jgi:hypothetical protein
VILFNKLKPSSRDAIKAEFYRIHATDEYQVRKYGYHQHNISHLWIDDFDKALNLSADAFQKFRYFHENPPDPYWVASPILEGARVLILATRPNWKVHKLGRNR